MVGMLVFALVITSVMVALGKGYEFVEASRQHTRASQILQSEIEVLRTVPWETFHVLTDTELTTAFQAQVDEQFGAGVFTGTVTTTTPATDLKQVRITVEWTGLKGRDYSMNYFTYFAEGGSNDYYITP